MEKKESPLDINKFAIRMNGMLEGKLKQKDMFITEEFRIPCVTTLLTKSMNFNYGEPAWVSNLYGNLQGTNTYTLKLFSF